MDVPSLKGIHYAMESGIEAAEAILEALKKDDTSAAALMPYDERMRKSYVLQDLERTRNVRLVYTKKGFWGATLRAGLMTMTKGALFGKRIEVEADAAVPREVTPAEAFAPDGKTTFSKVDAVFKSGNQTRDDIPVHLVVGKDVDGPVADLYAAMCPAGVYERDGDELVVNAPNCVDCKATDVIGPRWLPREGGSGPHYRRM